MTLLFNQVSEWGFTEEQGKNIVIKVATEKLGYWSAVLNVLPVYNACQSLHESMSNKKKLKEMQRNIKLNQVGNNLGRLEEENTYVINHLENNTNQFVEKPEEKEEKKTKPSVRERIRKFRKANKTKYLKDKNKKIDINANVGPKITNEEQGTKTYMSGRAQKTKIESTHPDAILQIEGPNDRFHKEKFENRKRKKAHEDRARPKKFKTEQEIIKSNLLLGAGVLGFASLYYVALSE
jgi:hypothetical protein